MPQGWKDNPTRFNIDGKSYVVAYSLRGIKDKSKNKKVELIDEGDSGDRRRVVASAYGRSYKSALDNAVQEYRERTKFK